MHIFCVPHAGIMTEQYQKLSLYSSLNIVNDGEKKSISCLF